MSPEKDDTSEARWARMDERLKGVSDQVAQNREHMDERFDKLEETLDSKYVTKEAFAPVQRIVYGAIALVLTTVVIGVLAAIGWGGT